MKVADISEQGRATQGVKLIRIDEGDEIAAITRIDVQDETGVITEIEDNTQATNLGEAASDQENGVTS
jgi:DNA gyrase subunit A